MLSILKGVYQVFRCVREFVLSLFFILFVLVCFAFVSLLSAENNNAKESNPLHEGALILNLDGYLADNHDEFSEFSRFLQSELGSEEPLKISTFDVVRAIQTAKNDAKIKGIVLDLTFFRGGDQPSLNFIGKALKDFKLAKKPIIAVGDSYSQKQYYLASFADEVYLNHAGFVDLNGLSYNNLYFKSLFEKLEAVPHVFRVGTYKSAVEPFIRDDMSAEAKANASLWLNQLWSGFRKDIAENRGIKFDAVVPDAERYLELYKKAQGNSATFALQQLWITHLASQSEIKAKLIETFGATAKGDIQGIDFFNYIAQFDDRFNVKAHHKIAVINVEGTIVWGESDEDNAGSDTLVKLLNKVRQDPNVEGLILRINSPGGSAMASEIIRQAVEDVQKSAKPVVVSMGGMAASGGYWIAATSDKIIASPNTLTGSIGIFGLAVTFEKTAKKLGISQDGIATSPLAEMSAFKTLSETQSDLIQISIENGYDRFLELVAKGRKMSKEDVDKVAQGQVWLGTTALEKGLVDQLGDFDDAHAALVELINQQRKQADKPAIKAFKTQWFIDQRDDFFSQIMRDFKMNVKISIANWIGFPLAKTLTAPMESLEKFNDPKQSYLYCLTCGEVK